MTSVRLWILEYSKYYRRMVNEYLEHHRNPNEGDPQISPMRTNLSVSVTLND